MCVCRGVMPLQVDGHFPDQKYALKKDEEREKGENERSNTCTILCCFQPLLTDFCPTNNFGCAVFLIVCMCVLSLLE